ncbi:hypothetical protein O9H85_08785 [Paenibacillus filicis]|uniref:Uncharacterized protein n=1 Tax=Paenibacillus gyeongsangnamensis TaxID=3388067 RepID=A0ABT4Q6K9_9BACL|nr:hypothetical protein [Paenibacillus filicis]MCZ8512510.1 hypothetical protein [Paenibacillus filicis]
MKKWTGTVMAGTVAAALLFGSFGGVVTPRAYADDDGAVEMPAPNTSIPLNQRVSPDLGTIVLQTSSILDMEDSDINDQLGSGKTLSDIVSAQGANRADVTNQIVQQLEQKVTNALNESVITSDEANQLNTQITQYVKTAFDTPGYKDHAVQLGASEDFTIQKSVSSADLANILGMTGEEFDKAVNQDGKKLADIAKDKGITEDQLIAKLKDQLTSTLQDFIHNK